MSSVNGTTANLSEQLKYAYTVPSYILVGPFNLKITPIRQYYSGSGSIQQNFGVVAQAGSGGNVVNQPSREPVSVLDLDGTNAVIDATRSGLLSHPGIVQARSGIATRVLGHRPSDVDFVNASGTGPMDGLMIVDGSTGLLWIRLRGVWQPIAAGGPVVGIAIKSTSYTVQPTDAIGVILCTASPITITMPAPSTVPMGRIYTVTNATTTGSVTVNGLSGTVNGMPSVGVGSGYLSTRFVTDGSNWYSA